MTKKGHQVFISEYQAPKDFICVWQKEVTNSIAYNQNLQTYREAVSIWWVTCYQLAVILNLIK